MKQTTSILLAALVLALSAQVAVAGSVTGAVGAIEQNKGGTSYFYRYTIVGVATGCGSALTSSTTYLWQHHETSGTDPFAKSVHDSLQLAKATGATVQVWFDSLCHVTDVVQL